MSDSEEIERLFEAGLELFNAGEYFDAHEEWEELWSEFNLPDRLFIQGLIQTTVSFYHLSTGNLKGARNLMRRAVEKFTERGPHAGGWRTPQRGTDSEKFIHAVKKCYRDIQQIDEPEAFDWRLTPTLEKVDERVIESGLN